MKRVDIFSKKYYTDFHNVDEDLRAIVAHGGVWNNQTSVGIALRNVIDTSTTIGDSVASSNMKKSLIMRISMMSTKT